MTKRWLVVIFILSMSFLSACGGAPIKQENLDQAENSEAFKVWRQEFDEEKIVKVEALPETFVAVTTVFTDKKRAKEAPVLRLIDGQGGITIWTGSENNASIVSGDPFPVVIEQDKQELKIQALKRSGETAWKVTLPQVSISAAVNTRKKELMILGAGGNWYEGNSRQPAVFTVLSLTDGSQLWQLPLGEMQLPKVVPSSVMTTAENSVWIAAGGRAIMINRQSQSVSFNVVFSAAKDTESASVPVWYADDKAAAMATDKGIFFFIADKGLAWSIPVTEKLAAPDTIAMTENTVIAEYQIFHKERAELLLIACERATGAKRWEIIDRDGLFVKWDRVQAPPKGMAVGFGKIVICIRGAMIWLDEMTGKEQQKIDIDAGEYHYAKNVQRWRDNAILYGKFNMSSFDLKTGQLAWRLEDFGDPIDYSDKTQKLASGMMKIGMQAAATMQEMSAQSMQSLANVKLAGHTGSQHSDYILSPSGRGQIIAAGFQAERNSAWYNAGGSLSSFYNNSKYIDLVGYNTNQDEYVLSRIQDTALISFSSLRFASATFVNLKDGTYKEKLTLRSQDVGGFSALCIDADKGMVYFSHHAIGILCKKNRILEAYKIP
ncbi:MAG: PQQ-binding-like beta-propeller repeat protein [bacterium]|nr:PQQ-binding-like beta-propeller repeat protein [bacterium]MDD5755878.1 PQQ-binding-like beta-propeller repeat protein [bacterium]